MNAEKLSKLNAIVALIKELVPGTHTQIDISGEDITLTTFTPKTYREATAFFRSWGCGVRSKQPFPGNHFMPCYTAVTGVEGPITLKAYPDELPPTCRKEKYVERIPKTQTIEADEFIEVEREKIVCGNGEPIEAASPI